MSIKISELDAGTTLDGTEQVPVVQDGATVRTTTAAIAGAASEFTGDIAFLADVALPGTSGSGIQTSAQTTPAWGWRDITSDITVRGAAGGTTPSWNVFRDGIRLYQFTVNDECWHVFHMPHDWVPGTDIHIHAHWAHASASVTSGGVSWAFEATWARGFDQAAYGATVTATATQTASTTQYQHMVAEVQLTAASPSVNQIDTDLIETDGLFLVRTYLSANTMNGTPEPFLLTVDLHYQSTNMATPNKAPSFYV